MKEKKEMIKHPNHYLKNSGFEVIDVIEAWDLDFCLGNAIKYICRHSVKGKQKDIQKAIHYLEMIMERDYGNAL